MEAPPPHHFPSHTGLFVVPQKHCVPLAAKGLRMSLPLCRALSVSLFGSTSGLANPNPSFGSQLGCLILQDASSEPYEKGPGAPPICSHSTLYLPTTALTTPNVPISPHPIAVLL